MRCLRRTGLLLALGAGACGHPPGGADSEGESGTGSESTGSESTGVIPDLGPELCGTHVDLDTQLPTMMFVVDRSAATVSHTWDHDGDAQTPEVTPWWSIRTLIEDIFAAAADDTACGPIYKPGLVVSPSADAEAIPSAAACTSPGMSEVEAWVLTEDAILQALPAADDTSLTGASPLADAFQVAVDELLMLDGTQGRFVMLFVHVPPTCAADAMDDHARFEELDPLLFDRVEGAYVSHAIGTYLVVVDAPDEPYAVADDGFADGVNPVEYFNELGLIGGRPPLDDPSQRYYTPDDVETLAKPELDECVCSCLVPLDADTHAPSDPQALHVEVDGQVVPFVTDCSNPGPDGGWIYSFPGEQIQLCGAACEGFDTTCYDEAPHERKTVDVRWPCE